MEHNLWSGFNIHEIHIWILNLAQVRYALLNFGRYPNLHPKLLFIPYPFIFGVLSLLCLPGDMWLVVKREYIQIQRRPAKTDCNLVVITVRQAKAVNSGTPTVHCAPFLIFGCALRISLPSWESTDDIIDRWWTISYTVNTYKIISSHNPWHPFGNLN